MKTDALIEKLFTERMLFIEPSEQLLAENAKFEDMLGEEYGLDFSPLKTDADWRQFRSESRKFNETSVFTPYLKQWAAKAADKAQQVMIPGPDGELPLRLIRPDGDVKGALLHTHGGAWVMGYAEEFDFSHARAVEECGLVVAALDYRLAPQHPHPAAPDDCEAAALWLMEYARREFGVDAVFVRGESAGGHLAVVTAMRLRRKHDYKLAGLISEIGLTDHTNGLPSRMSGFGTNMVSCREMTGAFLGGEADATDSDVSPAYATVEQLRDMPPAFFACGERDGFRDDALLMFMRWLQSGNEAYIAVLNGVGHNVLTNEAWESEFVHGLPSHFINRCLAGSAGSN